MEKSQVCDKYHYLKIQCSLVLGGGRLHLKRKVELGVEEIVQLKQLKPAIKVSGMRAEPTMWKVLLEHLELLGELQDLQATQFEVMEKHLEEVKGAWWVISAIGSALEELIKRVSCLEERSGSGSVEVRSI